LAKVSDNIFMSQFLVFGIHPFGETWVDDNGILVARLQAHQDISHTAGFVGGSIFLPEILLEFFVAVLIDKIGFFGTTLADYRLTVDNVRGDRASSEK
jgi:hypothetical protein